MKEAQNIKRILITLLKGSPIIVGALIIGLIIANKAIQYSTPKYQSQAKIKLDDRKYGFSGNNLYEDLDVFTSENRIETEAEILNSPLLIGKTLRNLKLNSLIWRKGQMKNTLLYKDNPFLLECTDDFQWLDEKLILKVKDTLSYEIRNEEGEFLFRGKFGDENGSVNGLSIHYNDSILAQKSIETNDDFVIQLYSNEKLIKLVKSNLDVKAVDKEIAVLRVVFSWEDPDFAADFANALCQEYIDDYILTKSKAAHKTLDFIDDRMIDISKSLAKSESQLESYKIDHDVVNTIQETETGLREVSKVQLQLINLQLEEDATKDLEDYIQRGDYYEETAITFGFGDLTLVELVKKLKLYTDEKKDLLLKYTDDDQRVINTQAKIDDVEKYIKEAVRRNLESIQLKRRNLEAELALMKMQFEEIPTREKELRSLEREFMNNESVYNFLFQKKLEAQIASTALISFHRNIQPAVRADKPVSPNTVLITFVCGIFALIIGVVIVFSLKAFSGKIINVSDIEKLTAIPVIGVLRRHKSPQPSEFIAIAQSLQKKIKDQSSTTLLITSSIRYEGKSYLSENLSDVFFKMGYRIAVLKFNPFESTEYNVDLEQLIYKDGDKFKNEDKKGMVTIGCSCSPDEFGILQGHKNFKQVMSNIQNYFDLVIIDSPGAVISPVASTLMPFSDVALYLVRSKKSKSQYISNADLLKEEFPKKEVFIVLNDVHSSTNYTGMYTGSMLNYYRVPKNFFARIIYRLKSYGS